MQRCPEKLRTNENLCSCVQLPVNTYIYTRLPSDDLLLFHFIFPFPFFFLFLLSSSFSFSSDPPSFSCSSHSSFSPCSFFSHPSSHPHPSLTHSSVSSLTPSLSPCLFFLFTFLPSQFAPVYWISQWQSYPFWASEHVPSFRQGFGWQYVCGTAKTDTTHSRIIKRINVQFIGKMKHQLGLTDPYDQTPKGHTVTLVTTVTCWALNPLSSKYLNLNSPNLPWTKCMNSVGRIGS